MGTKPWVQRAALSSVVACLLSTMCGRSGPSSTHLPEAGSGPSTRSTASSIPLSKGPPGDTSTFPSFRASVSRVTRSMVRFSWHPGCPVPVQDLRLLRLRFRGFDHDAHIGSMVARRAAVADLLTVFRKLYVARFPIERMRLVDVYRGDDDRSMAADNTSAFNCRAVTGGTTWSEHAYGRAVDINPLRNPYVLSDGTVLPPAGRRFADRSLRAKGMIHPHGVVVRAFAAVGWGWGGAWKDYQHFSSTGR